MLCGLDINCKTVISGVTYWKWNVCTLGIQPGLESICWSTRRFGAALSAVALIYSPAYCRSSQLCSRQSQISSLPPRLSAGPPHWQTLCSTLWVSTWCLVPANTHCSEVTSGITWTTTNHSHVQDVQMGWKHGHKQSCVKYHVSRWGRWVQQLCQWSGGGRRDQGYSVCEWY